LIGAVASLAASAVEVRVLHVWDPSQAMRGGEFDAEPEREARALVRGIQIGLQERGIRAVTTLTHAAQSRVAEAIVCAVVANQSDLVVLGAGSSHRVGRFVLGGVAYQMASRHRVPVLCAPSAHAMFGAPSVVLVAVGSDEAMPAPDVTAALGRTAFFRAHVFHACAIVGSEVVFYAEPEAPAWANVRAAMRVLRTVGIETTGAVRSSLAGVAEEILLAAAEASAEMIAIGPVRKPLPGRLFHGVAAELLAISDRPVLVAGYNRVE
jgi:nucleotide-binding universal stress UspA family protein